MAVKAVCLLGLGFYIALSVTDFVFTFALIKLSDGIAYESNPIAALFLDHHGWGALALYKAVLVSVFVASVLFVMKRKKMVGALLVVYGCALLTGVVIYSRQLIGEARQEIATRGPGWGPPPADPLKEPYLGLLAQR